MSKFEEKMKEKFPLLYKDMWEDPQKTCMSFGIEVGKGWYNLIEELSGEIEPIIEDIKEQMSDIKICFNCNHSKRWHWFYSFVSIFVSFYKNLKLYPIFLWRRIKFSIKRLRNGYGINLNIFNLPTYHHPCNSFIVPFPCAAQIKEKFGMLRFYMNYYNEEIEKIIHKYERKSKDVCERCGKDGELRTNRPWIKTLCDGCNGKNS